MEFYKLIEEEKKAAQQREYAEAAVANFYRMAEERGGKPEDYSCICGAFENVQSATAALQRANKEATRVRRQMKLHLLAILAE